MASWGFCISVFSCSGKPANCPEEMVCGVQCSARIEFVVWRSTFDEEAVGASTIAPMENPSSLKHHCAFYWQIEVHLLCLAFFQVHLVMFNVSPGLAF